MIFDFDGYLSDVKEIESRKGRKYLNGKLRENPYDYNYLNVGVRIPLDKIPKGCDVSETRFRVEVGSSWLDLPDGRKDCRYHFSVVSASVLD